MLTIQLNADMTEVIGGDTSKVNAYIAADTFTAP